MATINWPQKQLSVVNLHLDEKNPRLGRQTISLSPRDIINYLFENDKAEEIAFSLATRSYFQNEPLLAVKENNRYIVVEGNRRLAALKALHDPDLLDGTHKAAVERLSRRIHDLQTLSNVPVIIAPNRKATDRLVAGRHIGSPVLAWEAENRASFILEKLQEGYDNKELQDNLGFTLSDIEKARQTKAIADMARSVDLPDDVKIKLDNPRAKVFSTLERVFESTVGRKYLRIKADSEHGYKGTTTKKEFVRGFSKLITDVANRKVTSRTLNTNQQIEDYFNSWDSNDLPAQKKGTFVPSDVIQGDSSASSTAKSKASIAGRKSKSEIKTVLPRDLKVRYGNDRLVDIRQELVKLKREDYPNAGAVLLRVFFELTVVDYLKRTGELQSIIDKMPQHEQQKLLFGIPNMKKLVPSIIEIAKKKLAKGEAKLVEKAVTFNPSAPFTISDLNAFIHSPDLPTARDIQQFWVRTEPLLRMMLEQDLENT